MGRQMAGLLRLRLAMMAQNGEWAHARFVIVEFPSREAAEGWYRSPEYQNIIGLRLVPAIAIS